MNKEEAIKKIRKSWDFLGNDEKEVLETLIPELKESEDEMIRKELIEHIKANCESDFVLFQKFSPDDVITWLEKQGAQKPIDKVEPKFKVDDWITNGNAINHISKIRDDGFYCFDYGSSSDMIQYIDNTYHLWTIQDAEDGDVIAWDNSKCIALFKNIYDENSFNSYGFVGHCTGTFESRLSYHDIEGAHPATKEQRDFLFSKMKEADYEWDEEKKELKRIKQVDDFDTELKESKDEMIRKALIQGFNECLNSSSHYPKNAIKYWHGIVIEDIIAWLEKQGEQKVLEEQQ